MLQCELRLPNDDTSLTSFICTQESLRECTLDVTKCRNVQYLRTISAENRLAHPGVELSPVMWLEGWFCVCMCTHLVTMSAHESSALISYFSAAACHRRSYQKYIPDHNHTRTGCQNTSEHMSTNER